VAAEEGWDEAEVEAIRAYLAGTATPASPDAATQPPKQEPERPAAELDFPGADELEQAMSALAEPRSSIDTDALPPEGPETGEPAWPAEPELEPAEPDAHAGEPTPEPAPEPDLPPVPGEPEWLRGRQDAAARAYRRLRRIFPAADER
jgi:hypothetical protein